MFAGFGINTASRGHHDFSGGDFLPVILLIHALSYDAV